MFRAEIIDILNKNKPLRSDYDTYYFLYKINPDESLVKVDYDDIKDMVNGIKGALSPYDIDEGSPYIAQLLGSCNSDDVPKALVDKINKIIGKEK